MLQARDGRLHLVAEKEVPGAVYNVNPFQVRRGVRVSVGYTNPIP